MLASCAAVWEECLAVEYLADTAMYSSSNTIKTDTAKPYERISDFYAGKSVFITGGTGFLGKVLIERLLSTCTDIGSIYVLIRGKGGMNLEQRLQQMTDVPLFDKLKSLKPNTIKKIIPIEGDVTKPDLAIRTSDEQKLIDNVSVVIHSAATVSFADTFSDAMKINYEGTKKVVALGKKMKNLESFVYISTAFANADRLTIDEVVYPRLRKEEEVYSFIDIYGDDAEAKEKFLCGSPNSYSMSKLLSENYLQENRGGIKTIIVRPSIVTPMIGEPLPGWCDSWVAATALFSDVARGLTKAIYGHRDVVCDMIPVDYTCNLTIVAAARGNQSNDILVYNSCSSSSNPITWKRGSDLFLEESLKYGKYEMKPRKVHVSMSPLVVKFMTFTLQTVPSVFADFLLRLKGETPKYLKMQKRPVILRDIISKFTMTSSYIKSDNSLKLIATLDEKDKVLFPCDPRTISWLKYMPVFYRGVQKHLLKSKQ
ncbi:unnamed protein product [Euphydryas editha]|uniref:Fatty acyl-CoA reductase n=1 Tax=Euphydryas editha TaxID=104508 RepID=A0AAU9TCW8_EUPED|nr:unnamed protein product [Euphydryas editha]